MTEADIRQGLASGLEDESDLESAEMGGVASGMMQEEDDEFKPTQNEILEYAQFLGMDIMQDQDLLYIAEEGVSYQNC